MTPQENPVANGFSALALWRCAVSEHQNAAEQSSPCNKSRTGQSLPCHKTKMASLSWNIYDLWWMFRYQMISIILKALSKKTVGSFADGFSSFQEFAPAVRALHTVPWRLCLDKNSHSTPIINHHLVWIVIFYFFARLLINLQYI